MMSTIYLLVTHPFAHLINDKLWPKNNKINDKVLYMDDQKRTKTRVRA